MILSYTVIFPAIALIALSVAPALAVPNPCFDCTGSKNPAANPPQAQRPPAQRPPVRALEVHSTTSRRIIVSPHEQYRDTYYLPGPQPIASSPHTHPPFYASPATRPVNYAMMTGRALEDPLGTPTYPHSSRSGGAQIPVTSNARQQAPIQDNNGGANLQRSPAVRDRSRKQQSGGANLQRSPAVRDRSLTRKQQTDGASLKRSPAVRDRRKEGGAILKGSPVTKGRRQNGVATLKREGAVLTLKGPSTTPSGEVPPRRRYSTGAFKELN